MKILCVLLVLLLVSLFSAQTISTDWIIEDLDRTIDATTLTIRHTIRYTVVNAGSTSQKSFFVALPKEQASKLSYFEVQQIGDDKKVKYLSTKGVENKLNKF